MPTPSQRGRQHPWLRATLSLLVSVLLLVLGGTPGRPSFLSPSSRSRRPSRHSPMRGWRSRPDPARAVGSVSCTGRVHPAQEDWFRDCRQQGSDRLALAGRLWYGPGSLADRRDVREGRWYRRAEDDLWRAL